MVNSSFKVPYALNLSGSLIEPAKAIKGCDYICPECLTPLVFRSGQIMRPHFSHPATSNCSAETVLHKAAKFAIKEAVNHWLNTKQNRPVIRNRCTSCSLPREQPLPDKVTGVNLEKALESGHIADVVLMEDQKIILAIEVFVSNAVSKSKAKDMPVRWIELAGVDVLSDPVRWMPTQMSLNTFTCERCRNQFRQFQRECVSLANLTNVSIPEGVCLYGPTECERCLKWCLSFLWDKGALHAKNRPRTVQLIQIKNEHPRWLNTCAWCNHVLTLGYLNQRHTPFWFMKPSEAHAEERANNLMKIALHYFEEVRPRHSDKVVPYRELWLEPEG